VLGLLCVQRSSEESGKEQMCKLHGIEDK
jgi:hypothetical protein